MEFNIHPLLLLKIISTPNWRKIVCFLATENYFHKNSANINNKYHQQLKKISIIQRSAPYVRLLLKKISKNTYLIFILFFY